MLLIFFIIPLVFFVDSKQVEEIVVLNECILVYLVHLVYLDRKRNLSWI